MKNKIVNIGTLDVREISENTAKQLKEISNIATYVTNDQAEAILSHVKKVNVAGVIKCNEDIKITSINGNYSINKAMLDSISNKILLGVNGQAVIEEDVSIELLNEKILSGSINGQLIVPESLVGAVQTIFQVNGKVLGYESGVAYYKNNLQVTDEQMMSYFGPKKITVSKLVLSEAIDMDLFKETYEKIHVIDKLEVEDSVLPLVKAFLSVTGDVKVMKGPLYYHRGNADLSEDLLELASGKKIHVTSKLTCTCKEAISNLNQDLEARVIITKKEFKDQIRKFCRHDQKITLIEDLPKENYSEMIISKSRIMDLNKYKSFNNYGKLVFDDSLTLEDLNVDLRINNYGVIIVPEHLEEKVYDLLDENFGSVTRNKCNEIDDDLLYANMGSLVL